MPISPKHAGGRPRDLSASFGARLLARQIDCSDRHARRLLDQEVGHLNAQGWYAVAISIEAGIKSPDDFEASLRRIGFL
jgi:hypothetical protein